MNLQEQINRTKTLMGIQPLNEGIFKQKGKFKDLIKNLFNKGNGADQIIQYVNPYDEKYGTLNGPSEVVGITTTVLNNKQLNNTNAETQETMCSVSFITNEPQSLINDPTKKTQAFSYLIIYNNNQEGKVNSFTYFKVLYYVNGQKTDEISTVITGKNITCSTSTLEGKAGGCSLPQEIKNEILNKFKDSKDLSELQSYLDKIQ